MRAACCGARCWRSGRASGSQVESQYHVDPTGNLQNFDLRVRSKDYREELVHVTGRLQGRQDGDRLAGPVADPEPDVDSRLRSRGAWSATSWGRSTGCPACTWASAGRCRWSTRSRAVESVRVEVTRRTVIHWDGQPGDDVRGRAADAAPGDADVGPARRRDPAAGGAVPVRAAGARAPRRGHPEPPGSASATTDGRPSR